MSHTGILPPEELLAGFVLRITGDFCGLYSK